MRKAPLAAAAAVFAALAVAASPAAHASTPGVTTTRTYAAGTDTITVTWYENGVFTLARRIAITGPSAVTTDRYASTYCTTVQRGPGGLPPIVWSPVNGYRTQCLPYVNVNGAHLTPPSQDPTPAPAPAPTPPPTWVPFP